jgi:hypothetical protein
MSVTKSKGSFSNLARSCFFLYRVQYVLCVSVRERDGDGDQRKRMNRPRMERETKGWTPTRKHFQTSVAVPLCERPATSTAYLSPSS